MSSASMRRHVRPLERCCPVGTAVVVAAVVVVVMAVVSLVVPAKMEPLVAMELIFPLVPMVALLVALVAMGTNDFRSVDRGLDRCSTWNTGHSAGNNRAYRSTGLAGGGLT